ncbi:MAG: transcriptional repressor LexA [Planctomycetota bacterium]|nr:MAG: transcriptional repressor LexA [Planctomycetota bacterium]
MQLKKPINQLTPRQLQLLTAINSFQTGQYYSPTMAELASELGISRSTVFEHIAELRRKRLLSTSPGRARSLNLTSKARELLDQLADNDRDSPARSPAAIPLVGTVAAGVPIEAVEDTQPLSLRSHFAPDDNIFALRVRGDSMLDDDIRDGDYVICRSASVANNGQLVVAIVDNENATIKRFYRQQSRVKLQPSNDNYSPIYSDNCRIEAVVIGLMRKF